MKLTFTTAALALLAGAASAESTFEELRQCLDDGRVAILSERTGDVLYYNWASAECANVALNFEAGGGEAPIEPEAEDPSEPDDPGDEPSEPGDEPSEPGDEPSEPGDEPSEPGKDA